MFFDYLIIGFAKLEGKGGGQPKEDEGGERESGNLNRSTIVRSSLPGRFVVVTFSL